MLSTDELHQKESAEGNCLPLVNYAQYLKIATCHHTVFCIVANLMVPEMLD
jgi:hypothetical protein